MQGPSTVLLLTAGLGTRFRPYTEYQAKPSIPFLHLPLALHPLLLLDHPQNIKRLIYNTHYLPESVTKSLSAYYPDEILTESFEPEILGSGGGVKKALENHLDDEHVLVCNGDEVIIPKSDRAFAEFWQDHVDSGRQMTLLTIDHPEAGRKFGGVWADENGYIKGFGKQPFPQTQPIHYIGVYALSKAALKYMPDGNFNSLYDYATNELKKNPKDFKAYKIEADWFETGNIDSYLSASKDVLKYAKDAQDSKWFHNLKSFLPELKFEGQTLFNGEINKSSATKLTGYNSVSKQVDLSKLSLVEDSHLYKTPDDIRVSGQLVI